MTARFPGPGRDRFAWETVHVPAVAWDMLERFGWRRVDYGPDVEAWEDAETGIILVRETPSATDG